MRIQVTFIMDEEDEAADPNHEMGITNKAYERLIMVIPGYDVDVRRVD